MTLPQDNVEDFFVVLVTGLAHQRDMNVFEEGYKLLLGWYSTPSASSCCFMSLPGAVVRAMFQSSACVKCQYFANPYLSQATESATTRQ